MKDVVVQKEIRVKKCDKCDQYGTVRKLNYPDRPECGTYSPHCGCEFGRWMNQRSRAFETDMFVVGR